MKVDRPRTLLVADDDDVYRTRLATAFERRGFLVLTANNFTGGNLAARAHAIDLACVDLRMPGASGLELVRVIKDLHPKAKVVVLTGYGSIATALEAVHAGAIHYLSKPVDANDVMAAFDRTSDAPPAPIDHEVPSLARAEWEHINRVLADCRGNISRAARLLRIERRSLQRKLAKYPRTT